MGMDELPMELRERKVGFKSEFPPIRAYSKELSRSFITLFKTVKLGDGLAKNFPIQRFSCISIKRSN